MQNEIKTNESRNLSVLAYLTGLYVPVSAKESYEKLIEYVESLLIRSINANDSYKSHYRLLIIETKGNTPRKSFSSWRVVSADFGAISENYAMAYIRDENSERCFPDRLSLKSMEYSIII